MDELVSVVEARHVRGHVLWLRFSEGTADEIDLVDELRGEVFEPLAVVEFFAQVRMELPARYAAAAHQSQSPVCAS